jgi:molecular chaperone GrpE
MRTSSQKPTMDPKEQVPMPEESLDTVELDTAPSVDDFIRQLEEKEKDLHITAELQIEVEESEFDERNIPDDVVADELKSPAPAVSPKLPAASSPDVRQPGNKTRIYELEQEVDSLKKRLAVLREERNDVQEKSDRRLKDFESFKYRMDRERRGAFIDQISNLASQMLPVFDNLDRALTAAKELEKSPGFEQFYDGIVMVNQQMSEIFQDMGVEAITSMGQEFDPNFHEAVAVDESTDVAPNTVTAELLRGYRIGNRVIRHSMVKVTTGGAKAAAEVQNVSEPVDLEPPDEVLPTDTEIEVSEGEPSAEE